MVDSPRDSTEADTATPETEGDEPGRFEALLAEVDSWRSGESADPPSGDEPSQDASVSPPDHATPPDSPGLDSDPLERIRTILDTRDLPQVTPPAPLPRLHNKSRGVILGWLALLGLGSLVLGTVLFSGVLAPGLVDRPDPTVSAGTATLTVDSEEASYLNRVFRETSTEVAYCGRISATTGEARLELWMADTVSSGPMHIAFRTTNCPPQFSDTLLHTHPAGSIHLSQQDKLTLQARPETMLCVQAGPITLTRGALAQNIACYQQQTPSTPQLELTRIPIRITEHPAR